MAILPIDAGRYGTAEMRAIFKEEERLQRMLEVEAALALAQGKVGEIPIEHAKKIAQMASTRYVKLTRVKELEEETKHEVMAVVRALTEVCGPSGAYVHFGATSSDILDTATALQLKMAITLIKTRLDNLEKILMDYAKKYEDTIMVGRTHGQHALPITLGFKFAVWMREVSRNICRLEGCLKRVLVGKMSGAVGTQAGLGPHALEIQELAMKRLGLGHDISTQIVQRDHYAELICHFANIASSLEKFATEIRELQRPEIGELAEAFEEASQVGSSTLPHKKNPIQCERICGLAKIMRSLVIPALENISTWHERDLTQSSSERFIIPEGCILVDYMINLMNKVLMGLRVNTDRMKKNVDVSQGRIMSEAVMVALVKRGMGRQEAYDLVKRLSFISEQRGQPFKETLLEDKEIQRFLSYDEIEEVLDPRKYLGTTKKQVDMAIRKTLEERKARGLQ